MNIISRSWSRGGSPMKITLCNVFWPFLICRWIGSNFPRRIFALIPIFFFCKWPLKWLEMLFNCCFFCLINFDPRRNVWKESGNFSEPDLCVNFEWSFQIWTQAFSLGGGRNGFLHQEISRFTRLTRSTLSKFVCVFYQCLFIAVFKTLARITSRIMESKYRLRILKSQNSILIL